MTDRSEGSVAAMAERVSGTDSYFSHLSEEQIARVIEVWHVYASYMNMSKAELLTLFDSNFETFERDIAIWQCAAEVFDFVVNNCHVTDECSSQLAYLLLGELSKDVSQSICLARAPVSISHLRELLSEKLTERQLDDQFTLAP